MSIQAEVIDGSFSVDTVVAVREEGIQTLDVPTFRAKIRFKIDARSSETVQLKNMCREYIERKFAGWLTLPPHVRLADAHLDHALLDDVSVRNSPDDVDAPHGSFHWCLSNDYHNNVDDKFFSRTHWCVEVTRWTDDGWGYVDWCVKLTHFRENGMVVVTPVVVKEGCIPQLQFSMDVLFALGKGQGHEPWLEKFKADIPKESP